MMHMPQKHFSVGQNSADRLALAEEHQGLSLSRYLALLVLREAPADWPAAYLEQVVGSCRSSGLADPFDPPNDDI